MRNAIDALNCLCACSLRSDLSDATLLGLADEIVREFKVEEHSGRELLQAYDDLTPREFARRVQRWNCPRG